MAPIPSQQGRDRESPARQAVFVTTKWSQVLAAGGSGTDASRQALESLCQGYWYPLYAYARRKGNSVHDAEDLTQGFFARLLAKGFLQSVDRDKGRFRTFLLVAFKRHLANEWHRARAAKRGGEQVMLPLDTQVAEQRYAIEAGSELSPEAMYDRRWALTLIEHAMSRLRESYVAAGKLAEFESLKGYLTAERGGIPYVELAESLGCSEGAARMAIHRLRKKYRELFREEIAQTMGQSDDYEDEIRLMLAALGG